MVSDGLVMVGALEEEQWLDSAQQDLVYKASEKCSRERERLTDGPRSSMTQRWFQNHLASYWVHGLPLPQLSLR